MKTTGRTSLGRARPAWAAVAALVAAATLGSCTRRPQGTNVVVISLDTLRRDRLNCYGYQARRLSPHIDALAADSVLFEGAVSASPWTTPSHMTLLTSLAPSSHGVITPFQRLLQDVRNGTVERLPEARVTLAETLAGRGFATAAFTGGVTLDPVIGFGQGFSRYDVSMVKMNDSNMGTMKAWIAERRNTPFFLFWHTFEVHAPYLDTTFVPQVVAEETAREVDAAISELGRHFFRGPAPPEDFVRLQRFKSHHRELSNALYDGGVLSADRWVGELMRFLRESGLYDRTLIVLTSDHGEELWERGPGEMFGAHGHSLYEEMIGVPLLVKLPAQAQAGSRVAAPAPAVDVMPTILDVLRVPEAATGGMEGHSLRALWERRDAPGRLAFSEALAFEAEEKSVRTDRYKYVLAVPAADVERHGRRYLPDNPQRRLFDLRTDPGERNNLLRDVTGPGAGAARTPPRPDVPPALVEALDQRLRQYVAAHFGKTEQAVVSPETIEKLRALGYLQ